MQPTRSNFTVSLEQLEPCGQPLIRRDLFDEESDLFLGRMVRRWECGIGLQSLRRLTRYGAQHKLNPTSVRAIAENLDVTLNILYS
jgi:hypothetical protein